MVQDNDSDTALRKSYASWSTGSLSLTSKTFTVTVVVVHVRATGKNHRHMISYVPDTPGILTTTHSPVQESCNPAKFQKTVEKKYSETWKTEDNIALPVGPYSETQLPVVQQGAAPLHQSPAAARSEVMQDLKSTSMHSIATRTTVLERESSPDTASICRIPTAGPPV